MDGSHASSASLVILSLPGLAALAALLFTWMQVGQASKELRISEQGQITGRFNVAITNLGSSSVDVRLGGIYALERIMLDSARDHPTVVSVLAAYVRRHAPVTTTSTARKAPPDAEINAAMNILAGRRPDRDKGMLIDLSRSDLSGWKPTPTDIQLGGVALTGSDLRGAELAVADLHDANLEQADLSDATMYGANLRASSLLGANLRSTNLVEADITNAWLCTDGSDCPDLTKTNLTGASLSGASLVGADLVTTIICSTSTEFVIETEAPAASHPPGRDVRDCADLSRADLSQSRLVQMDLAGANLAGALLTGANLAEAHLKGANLAGADLTGADLSKADLTNADLSGANLTRVDVTGARHAGAKLKGTRGVPDSFL
ncbi:pentapeptide repeat-containing protein [Streptomyces spororaveus]|uniref:pentapeptide repeat-containing protein n=1 Tax=Streptomyces spororaveus TaxID=284039 RepID=UPI003677FD34